MTANKMYISLAVPVVLSVPCLFFAIFVQALPRISRNARNKLCSANLIIKQKTIQNDID